MMPSQFQTLTYSLQYSTVNTQRLPKAKIKIWNDSVKNLSTAIDDLFIRFTKLILIYNDPLKPTLYLESFYSLLKIIALNFLKLRDFLINKNFKPQEIDALAKTSFIQSSEFLSYT